MIKCNVDAAAFDNNSVMGYGMCFRDSMGVLLLGKSDFYYSSATVLEAESLGLLDAIKVAISHGMRDILTSCLRPIQKSYLMLLPPPLFPSTSSVIL
ncbi:hypothetical protein MTR_2g028885 [Medicago truncatula]|uniref:RNase H type-1 domain-containing protein n=1 Tax=Medicago truncatula TaxID=3880 RepID=A0A072V5U8_MEDTR|nr:hypothetical protein MTR_2g028885 [Medicago truncatula]